MMKTQKSKLHYKEKVQWRQESILWVIIVSQSLKRSDLSRQLYEERDLGEVSFCQSHISVSSSPIRCDRKLAGPLTGRSICFPSSSSSSSLTNLGLAHQHHRSHNSRSSWEQLSQWGMLRSRLRLCLCPLVSLLPLLLSSKRKKKRCDWKLITPKLFPPLPEVVQLFRHESAAG